MRALWIWSLLVLAGCGRVGYGTDTLVGLDAGRDAAIRDASALDAAPLDAAGPDGRAPEEDAGGDACVATPEDCNGEDDDCDGTADETFTVVAGWGACSAAPRGGSLTLVARTWDREDAVREAMISEGDLEVTRIGTLSTPGALALDPARTLGNLLAPPATTGARWAPFPEAGGDPMITPNVTRAALELSWSVAWAMRDGPGDDLVVYEHGDPITEPEAFAISVRDARTGVWSRARFEHFDTFSMGDEMFATAYDLADFGLAGGVVDRVRLHNVFGAAAAMPDRVSDASGEGFVVRGGEPGWDAAHALLGTAGGASVPTELLDTDLLFVVALYPTVDPRCCVVP